MCKAEDLAKELYPDWKITGVPTVDGQEESIVRIQRVSYIKGYKQAEKDLSDQVRNATEIAREEIINKLRKWVSNKNERDSFTFGYINRHFDELLKQVIKNE